MEIDTQDDIRQWSSFEKWISFSAAQLKRMYPAIGYDADDLEQELRLELFKMWDRDNSNNNIKKWAYLKVKRRLTSAKRENFYELEEGY